MGQCVPELWSAKQKEIGNRQKSSLKKVFGNKVLNFSNKIILLKKVLELKSLLK